MAAYAYLVLVLALHAFNEADATSYASLASPDDSFKLQWTYNNSKLIFKMTCKTTGWCAVGFTETADGKGMVNYDIAVGGFASGAGYVEDYWSTTTGSPPKDTTQNFELITASENGGQTVVEFSRDALTQDDKDVQFMNDTEVKVVWAYHSSSDADVSLTAQHTARGILSGKHNLIMMAMSAMQSPSTTVGIQPSATMITPTSSRDSGVPTTAPPSYESLASTDGYFKLQWTYENKKLIFIITCKTTGWCAVGFTINPGGRYMNNYDIVAGGFASGAGYIGDYWSTATGLPPRDAMQNVQLMEASENGGYTVVKFSRNAVTGDDKDVQFKDDTEVTVVWALHSSSDANNGLSEHTNKAVLSGKHNLIKMAMAAKQPKNTASVIVPSVVSVLLILSAYLLSF